MKIGYQVLVNGSYVNSFKTYSQAMELVESFEKKFKRIKIEIISIYY